MFNKLSSLFKYNISNSYFCLKKPNLYENRIQTLFNFNFGRNIHSLTFFNTHIPSFYKIKSFHTHLFNDRRNIATHKPRRQIGHKFEFIIGKHKRAKVNPPRVPIHPTKDVDKDMNLFETYRDLKLRWKRTTRSRKNKVKIARKWRQPYYFNPTGQPTCMFVLHENLPRTRNDKVFYKEDEKEYVPMKIELDESHNFDVYPPASVVEDVRNMKVETFCIFKSSPIHQHKVFDFLYSYSGYQGGHCSDREAEKEERWYFSSYLTENRGQSDFWNSVAGRIEALDDNRETHVSSLHLQVISGCLTPRWRLQLSNRYFCQHLPYTPFQDTLQVQEIEKNIQIFKVCIPLSKLFRVRHWVTVLRIDNIVVDPSMEINTEHKASRLLDLWSNRWLYTEELEGLNNTRDISQGTPYYTRYLFPSYLIAL
ncbi:50S ribosomal protein L21 [Theileria orientalis strain Shintoku]|uniref:50S ribosomal protein L21 n=1 Tax=Theileria orientalis strain Shintoku TaxID=869250 RepID=J4CDT6_THEOR|nr:50S ribosomal protein L21 [Theileria orientalis strain Shintoku]BAM41707.1 50S ribosomal protein L21 [Theileria orientalis strain Shintoku]|eukprot:XP_009692008.1 50S ribosomal protein L21 [Theileria orientalis strain Shintoku]